MRSRRRLWSWGSSWPSYLSASQAPGTDGGARHGSLPPCGGGTGGGGWPQIRSLLLPPSPTLPRKGGGSRPGPRQHLGQRFEMHHYSILMFPFFATSAHCASSRLMIAANSSDVLP